MSNIDSKIWDELSREINGAEIILLSTHINPDGDEPSESDVAPSAMATPKESDLDREGLKEPKIKESKKPKEVSNPTLKETPKKSDPKLKPQLELPTEGDLK